MKKENKTNNRINNIVRKLSEEIIEKKEVSEIIEVEDLICEVRFTIYQELQKEKIFGIINKYVKEAVFLAKRYSVNSLSMNTFGLNVYLSNEGFNESVSFEGEIRKKNMASYWDRMEEK